MLKNFLASTVARLRGEAVDAVEFPLELEAKLNALHGRAPIDRHLEILFRDVNVGAENFAALYRRCLAETGTPVTPFNVFHRFQGRRDLLQYFFATMDVPGARAECGVYRGATALLMAHAWRSRQPAFDGDGLYLIDRFVGTSESGARDLIPVRDGSGLRHEPFFAVAQAGLLPETVRSYFGAFPKIRICADWIPQVFSQIAEINWAFVHLDVTLYAPTRAALEYFHPRLNQGGVIVCDGSPFCPGARAAWDEFCAERDLPFIVLGNRECVLIKSTPA
jgi:O-methyltransferase